MMASLESHNYILRHVILETLQFMTDTLYLFTKVCLQVVRNSFLLAVIHLYTPTEAGHVRSYDFVHFYSFLGRIYVTVNGV